MRGAQRRWYLLSWPDDEGDTRREGKGGWRGSPPGYSAPLSSQCLQLCFHAVDLTLVRDEHSVFLC